jgi:Kef-type K+ transport system membrane component KefB/mannitol/fructose-specific phosphotransferase system IIA component (Ntr-type)
MSILSISTQVDQEVKILENLTQLEIVKMFLALFTILGTARFFAELAQRWHQPAVLGEILAGVLLGPTLFGTLFPDWSNWLFPMQGHSAVALQTLKTLAIVLFLLVAGLEVDLATVWRQGKTAATVGFSGLLFPFMVGFISAWTAPWSLGWEGRLHPLLFALFFATALSISALPVIARTLMDLKLYRTDLGMIIIAAAIFNDIIGWIIFAMILGMMEHQGGHGMSIVQTIVLTLFFAASMLTLGRGFIHYALPWVKAHTSWPAGTLTFALVFALPWAAFTEYIGIHAVFGAFLAGVALGNSSHIREQTRMIIEQFVSFFFAPLFFGSIGLTVNFIDNFDLGLVLTVLIIACVGKVGGCTLGARLSGMPSQQAWALGFGMNARGAMEIILGLLALQYGVINEHLFVALVVMALATSMISGPMMQWVLGRKKERTLDTYLSPRTFCNELHAHDSDEALTILAQLASSAAANLNFEKVLEAVQYRENLMPTGVGNGVAVPHASIEGVTAPVVAVGLSRSGVDFDNPDGSLAHIVFLLLTSPSDEHSQIDIITEISRLFGNGHMWERALEARNYTEFRGLIRSGGEG